MYATLSRNAKLFYFSTFDKLSATEAFKEGETGLSPRNTLKRAEATFADSIVASTVDGNPFEETET